MATNEKMTNQKALEFVLGLNLSEDVLPVEVAEKLEKMADQFGKKSAAPKKPTKTQQENAIAKEALLDLFATFDTPKTVSDVQDASDEFGAMSNQKVSALVRQLVAEGKLVRIEDKRKAFFTLPATV